MKLEDVNQSNEQLERLISRFLDDEADRQQRGELKHAITRDPAVGALFDDYAAIDREVRVALRRQFGRRAGRGRALPLWRQLLRGAGVAAAAAILAALWPQVGGMPAHPRVGAETSGEALAGSWFAEPPSVADELLSGSDGFQRTIVQDAEGKRRWILIPTDEPGQFMLLQIDETQMRSVPVIEDF